MRTNPSKTKCQEKFYKHESQTTDELSLGRTSIVLLVCSTQNMLVRPPAQRPLVFVTFFIVKESFETFSLHVGLSAVSQRQCSLANFVPQSGLVCFFPVSVWWWVNVGAPKLSPPWTIEGYRNPPVKCESVQPSVMNLFPLTSPRCQ